MFVPQKREGAVQKLQSIGEGKACRTKELLVALAQL